MATFTLLVSISGPNWIRRETPATNEQDLVQFLMNSWLKDQCHLNFLEIFLRESSPDALRRIFPEGSVASSSTDDDDEEDETDAEGPVDDDEEEDEEDDLDSTDNGSTEKTTASDDDSDTDTIMICANTYVLTSTQRQMFVNEIQIACQPVGARRRFFEMCRLNSPSIVFIKPDGFL
jgi:hypothetical protein